MNNLLKISKPLFLPLGICFLFFICYSLLGLERYYFFSSGYDIAVIDQTIWKYSHFMTPFSSNHAYTFTPILTDHVELIFLLIAPLYWIWDNIQLLIVLQVLLICSSGIPVFFLSRKKNLSIFTSIIILIGYLSFYGIQNAVWADVHSLVIGVSFVPWYIYFLEQKKWKWTWLFFLLTVISKEDLGLFTLIISFIYFIKTRKSIFIWQMAFSFLYLFVIFFVYFPHFVQGGYRFSDKNGLFSHISLADIANSKEKQQVWFYTFSWFGFLPLLSPLYVIPAFADILKYFVFANEAVSSGQSIFGHYRSSLAFFTVWPTILTIKRFIRYQRYLAIYLFVCLLLLQYILHAPLSYLAKKWFWTAPASIRSMNEGLTKIPDNTAVVSQVNFLPRLAHREYTFLLWPEKKIFKKNSPCGKPMCDWFRWAGKPDLMIVDTSSDWDARYWLTNRQDFINGIANLQKKGIISPLYTFNTTKIYQVKKNPN